MPTGLVVIGKPYFYRYYVPNGTMCKHINEGCPKDAMKSFSYYFYRFGIISLGMLAFSIIVWLFFYDRSDIVVKNEVYRSRQLSSDKLRYLIESERIKTVVNLRGA